MIKILILSFSLLSVALCMVNPTIVTPTGYNKLKTSNQSSLYQITLPTSPNPYQYAPYLLVLKGDRKQIGYDYAALLHEETVKLYTNFMSSMFDVNEQKMIETFIDFCWDQFLSKYTPNQYLDELKGMKSYYSQNGIKDTLTAEIVSHRFYTLANMPADSENIIAMLEQEFEEGWPEWLKIIVNTIIKLLEKIIKGCDAYGVWGARTKGGYLYTSRNLDWNKNTGIDQFKLVTFYQLSDTVSKSYATLGFSFGMGALAGISDLGITVSEMNLDNNQVTFSGLAFPLRLRSVLEQSKDLDSAIKTWSSTNNTNSFNFLIGSSYDAMARNDDAGAYALETIMGYTSIYMANSDIEKSAKYYCEPKHCNWVNQTGWINIGKPIPNAVFRSNHAFDPHIMITQEALFNNTVVRYNLMHDLFVGLENSKTLIDDTVAVSIAATLGTKGKDYYTCDYVQFTGDNVMSIAYAPGNRENSGSGHFYIAWEQSGKNWRPAACNPYVRIDFNQWLQQ